MIALSFSGIAGWLGMLTILIILLVALLFILPPLVYRPVTFDLSAIRFLSEADAEEVLRLPRAVRPDGTDIPFFLGGERVRPRKIRDRDARERFESEHGLDPYNAATLVLALERSLTIYSDDPEIMKLYKKFGASTDSVQKLVRKEKKS